MNRLRFVVLLVSLLTVPAVLVGCGSESSSQQTAQAPAEETQEQTMNASGGEQQESDGEQQQQTSGSTDQETQHQEEAPGHSHAEARAHGGQVTMTKQHHFELVYEGETVKVYGYDKGQNPISLEGVSGELRLKTRGGDSRRVDLETHGADTDRVYLRAQLTGLEDVEPGNAKLTLSLNGVPGAEETVEFTQTYEPRTGAHGGGQDHGEEGHHEEDGGHHDE